MTPGRAPTLTRRAALLALAAAGCASGVHAAGRTLPPSTALPQEIARALAQGQPLVVMVSLHACPFCEVVRNNYLAPMHEREGLPVVQINMLDDRPTTDPTGHATTHGALVRAWGVKVAPTLLFLGKGGAEIAPRLAGGETDFYAATLDSRLEQARKHVGS